MFVLARINGVVMGLVLCLYLAMVVGCASPEPEPELASKTPLFPIVTKLGILPVSPPREDLRVGDIFVHSPNSVVNDEPFSRWETMDLQTELESEYQSRRPWPKTPDSFLQIASDPMDRILFVVIVCLDRACCG